MNGRIKTIRATIGLTQTEFGARIGVKGNTVTGYETGIRNPSDAVIFSICREFNVREEWLRTGNGDMFNENPLKSEVGYYIEELLEDYEDNPFYDMIINMIKTYSELDEKSKKVIRDCADKLKKNMEAQEIKPSHASQDT